MPKRGYRKGQSEAVGLLVIVILMIFIGFIYLRFSLRGGGNDYQSVRQSIEARGLLHALLQLETNGMNFQDEVAACYYDSTQCLSLEQKIQDIFQAILQGDYNYHLILTGEDRALVDKGNCQQGIVSRVPFTFEGVFYEGTLVLCRSS